MVPELNTLPVLLRIDDTGDVGPSDCFCSFDEFGLQAIKWIVITCSFDTLFRNVGTQSKNNLSTVSIASLIYINRIMNIIFFERNIIYPLKALTL